MRAIHRLDRFQKFLLLCHLAMILLFAVIYPITMAKDGIRYQGKFLVAEKEGNNTTFSGKLNGQTACFTLTEEGSVEFRHGNQRYGPYTVKEDPAVIPANHEYASRMTGIELREGEFLKFRGGMFYIGDTLFLYDEEGNAMTGMSITVSAGGVEYDQNGNVVDPIEPPIATILTLINGPELIHRGSWLNYSYGVLLSLLNCLSIFFAEQLFQLASALRFRNSENTEPSELYCASRAISWIFVAILAFCMFVIGLK